MTELTRFVAYTGHVSATLRTDSEPTTLAALHGVRKVCRNLGIRTAVELAAVDNHQGNGAAEQTQQPIRPLASLFVSANAAVLFATERASKVPCGFHMPLSMETW